jgi:carbamoyltransferase
VLAERADQWFDVDGPSPYMMFTADVLAVHRCDPGEVPEDVRDWVNQVRSDIPAVTHVDGSARLQTVDRDRAPELHAVLEAFEALTGCPILVNTSFNVRGEPIVCTPEDAYACFARTEMDALVLEDCVLLRDEQPPDRLLTGDVEAFALD